jgi:hypothetical protein
MQITKYVHAVPHSLPIDTICIYETQHLFLSDVNGDGWSDVDGEGKVPVVELCIVEDEPPSWIDDISVGAGNIRSSTIQLPYHGKLVLTIYRFAVWDTNLDTFKLLSILEFFFFRNSRGKPRILGYGRAYARPYPKIRPSSPRRAPGQAGKYQRTVFFKKSCADNQ